MTRVYEQYRRRISFLSLIVLVAWGGLGFRLFNIQVADGERYRKKGQKQGITKEVLPAIRGNISDANGLPLTRNTIHFTIVANPAHVQDKNKVANTISTATGKPINYYTKRLSEKSNFVYLERNLQRKYAQQIIEKSFDGITIKRNSSRSYPQDNIGGQLVGFTNVDNQGLVGLENIYDKELSGIDGWIVKQRSGLGSINLKNSYPKNEPVDGADIKLTINIKYQSVLQEELLKQLKNTDAVNASGVIINPQTGAILAMASVPDFNPNSPNKFPTENQRNRAFTDQFEPGSTFKIIAATAAIDNNIVKIEDKFDCENGSYKFKNITISDHKPHNILTFGEIVEQSSNIGIIKIASKIGKKTFYKYAREYGFGSSTNIGLSAEASGILRKVDEWSHISIAEIAMGHEIGATALQLAMAYGAVANGGILLKPFIIKNIDSSSGEELFSDKPTVIRKIAEKKVMRQLTQLLVNAVETGTGVEANIPGWHVAGKTGTAQKSINGEYSHTKYISNFAGFLPANNPQVLCVIVIDEPKIGYHWGGTGAAPVFKQVMERIINLDDSIQMPENFDSTPTTREPILVKNNGSKIESVMLSSMAVISNPIKSEKSKLTDLKIIIPNVRGMSLKKALNTLHNFGLKSKFAGSGTVIWQSPKPGTVSSFGDICSIGLE